MGSGGGYEQGSTQSGPWEGQQQYLSDLFAAGRQLTSGKNLAGNDVITNQANGKGGYNPSQFAKEWLNNPMAYKYFGYDEVRDPGTNELTSLKKNTAQNAVAPFDPTQMIAKEAIERRAYNNPLNTAAKGATLSILGGENKINPNLMTSANIGYNPNMLAANVDSVNVGNVRPMEASSIEDLNFAGENELNRTAQGGYLEGGGNPYIDPMFKAATRQLDDRFTRNIIPGIDSSAELSGRFGSDIWNSQRQDANRDYLNSLDDLAAQMYGSAYETERGRMMDAGNLNANLGLDVSKTNAILGQEAEKTNIDALLNELLTQAGINKDLNLARSGNVQEAGRVNTQLGLEKGINQANLQQEANRLNPAILNEVQGQNIANQMDMTKSAPNLALQDYEDYARAAAVGEEQQLQRQKEIDQEIAAWEFYNQELLQRIGNYSNLVSGSYGGTAQTSAKSGK